MLESASLSETGGREINEDYIGFVSDGVTGFFVLADGLGGHGHGEVASQLVVECAMKVFLQAVGGPDMDMCFLEGQNQLVNEQRKRNASDEMKTTLVCLYINQGRAKWGHIGDSRLYHFKNGKAVKRTLDHSVSQMLVTIGEIREKEIRGHADRNRLTRVMGMEWDSPKYELAEETMLSSKDAFLLCSDGFWELITEHEMEKALKKADTPGQWLEKMKQIVEKNGAGTNMDNYSAIAVYG